MAILSDDVREWDVLVATGTDTAVKGVNALSKAADRHMELELAHLIAQKPPLLRCNRPSLLNILSIV